MNIEEYERYAAESIMGKPKCDCGDIYHNNHHHYLNKDGTHWIRIMNWNAATDSNQQRLIREELKKLGCWIEVEESNAGYQISIQFNHDILAFKDLAGFNRTIEEINLCTLKTMVEAHKKYMEVTA